MENNEKIKLKLGELFCGPGGLALGATMAKNEKYEIIHAWANDYDEDTCKTYRNNICPEVPGSVFEGDVKDFKLEGLEKIDIFAYGFPCNDFSIVGEQKGIDGHYGGLYTYGVDVLNKFQPDWFVAENVGGLKSANDGEAFTKIKEALAGAGENGYNLYPNLYKFEEYGIPQARHRMIIVGIKKGLPYEFKIPKPSNKIKTCKEAIETPPIKENAKNNEHTKQSETVIRRLGYIKPGQNAFNADLPDDLKLNVKGAKLSQIYKRLDPDKPAYTITGSGGGGTHVYHWEEPRALTNRERARLQTFPDNYVFEGSKESVRKQIGMAVPPEGARIIFEAILDTIAGIEYESIEPTEKE
jgi:DNA (cytosine-5)-methyltransferase 1